MAPSTSSTSLLESSRKKSYRDHYVNGTPFTVAMATFAVVVIGGAICGASMFVAGTAKEAQELLPATPADLHSKTYGATHAGVGFANYVVGNAVSNFWSKEMGKSPSKQKMSDPFASFLLKPKKGAKGPKPPEQQADDAQPVDAERGRIGTAKATPAAMRHAQDVAASHVKAARARGGTRAKAAQPQVLCTGKGRCVADQVPADEHEATGDHAEADSSSNSSVSVSASPSPVTVTRTCSAQADPGRGVISTAAATSVTVAFKSRTEDEF